MLVHVSEPLPPEDARTKSMLPELLAIPDGVQGVPPLLDKPARAGEVNGWLCRGVSCLEPSNDLVHLRQILREKT